MSQEGFADPAVAQRARDALTQMMISVLDQERPPYQYGTVTQIDPDLDSCLVLLPPDTEPVRVRFGAMRPAAVGQVVRVSGYRNDRFISDVIGGAVLADVPITGLSAPTGVLVDAEYEGVTVRWGTVVGAVNYEVHVADDAAFTVNLRSFVTVANSLRVANLPVGVTVYARVRGLTSYNGTGTWSATASGTPMVLPTNTTDGSPPSVSPGVVVTPGIGYLLAEWLPVSNVDDVTYEVHISTGSGFTPVPGTKLGETSGTFYFVRRLPTGFPLSYGVTYFIRVIARDGDGSAAAGAQGSGAPVLVEESDVGNIPTSAIGDGSAPSVSPTPTITNGIGFLFAKWDHPANADPITYEIHVSTATGFTPSTNTLVGATESNFAFIRQQGAGGTPANGTLVYGTTYFVKLIAKDVDGQAAAGGQGSGTPLQTTGTDIGPTAISTGHIQAGSITAASGIIADAAIATAKIQDAAITTAKIGDAQITTAKIGDLQVITAKIADAAISTAKIGDAQITNAKIANLSADKIISGTISASTAITIASGGVIQSSNYVAGTSGFQIRGNGSTEFTGAAIIGGSVTGATFKTSGTANAERIEITSVQENIDGYVANYIKFFSPKSDGLDPYRPGRLFADMTGTNTGLLYLRSPYSDVGSGQAMMGLESDSNGNVRTYFGGGNSGQPFVEFRGDLDPNQINFYDVGKLTVFGTFHVSSTSTFANHLTMNANAMLRADGLQSRTGGGGYVFCADTAWKLSFQWDNTNTFLYFYINDTYVKGI